MPTLYPPCMSQLPLVQDFAEHSRELSRVSQVLFSCASFWQGLGFAVQKSLVHGQSLFSCSAAPGGMEMLWAATGRVLAFLRDRQRVSLM